jgi:hypothetical protein
MQRPQTAGQKEPEQADILDELFTLNKDVSRPVRTADQRQERLALAKQRLPILQEDEEALPLLPQAAGEGEVVALDRTPQAIMAEKKASRTPYTQRQAEQIAAIMGMPGVVCNNCPAAESCPEFKENTTCVFEEDFSGLSARDAMNLVPRLELFADMQAKRAVRGAFLEARIAGGQIDPNVTRQIEIAAMASQRVMQIKQAAAGQGTQSISVISQGGGGGLISKLMSVMGGAKPEQPEIVTVVATETRITEGFQDASSQELAQQMCGGENMTIDNMKEPC